MSTAIPILTNQVVIMKALLLIIPADHTGKELREQISATEFLLKAIS